MVLSNKKLKQKLRETLAESLAAKESTKNESKTQPKSLKELLDSVTQKPRLSKREKRKKVVSSEKSSSAEGIVGDDDTQKEKIEENGDLKVLNDKKEIKKKNKKRKREDGEKENGVVDSKEGKPAETKKRNKKKKKNKNKNKKTEKNNKETKLENVEKPEAKETAKLIASAENMDVGVANKVYVGGIPYYSTEDDIRSFFDSCGTITDVDCMTFPESGKFRGIAMITFKTEAAAKRALALDGADMGGLFLKIQSYKANRAEKPSDFSPQMVEGYNRVYVGNLSWDITEDELRKLFSDCKISSIRFGEDKTTGEFRGYAHVDFSDSLSLSVALKLDQKVVCGRPVRIRCAVPMKRSENHSRSSTADTKNTQNDKISSSGGKKKRRKCYECGTPGHLSSACPNKQAVDSARS